MTVLTNEPRIQGHVGPWTIAAVEALPEDGSRYELLSEGVLTVSPAAGTSHQRVSLRLALLLLTAVEAVNAPVEILENINVELPGGLLAIPDVVAVDREFAATDPVRYPAETVRVAVEIVSPGSEPQDRVNKPKLYARAGIPAYWRFELKPEPHLVVFELRKGRYVRLLTAPAGAHTAIPGPIPCELDPAELARQR